MRYLRRFESIDTAPEYAKYVKVGDILVCIKSPRYVSKTTIGLQVGRHYEVLEIFRPDIELLNYHYYFDLKDIETGAFLEGWGASLFSPLYENNQNKYNL